MAESKPDNDPTLVERWLHDQQQWQGTLLAYLDSMMKNDDFLVHLGNAMRGSLLAGKKYPTAAAAGAPADDAPADDRLDQVLFALHQLQGQLQDLSMTLDEIRSSLSGRSSKPPATQAAKPSRAKRAKVVIARPKTRKRRVRG